MVRTDCSAADVGAAARGFLLHLAQLARDVGRRGAQRQQAGRVESTTHLARDAADARHRAHAAHGQQALATVLSTNQDSASSSIRECEATV
jgi:hypothetical protein